MIQFLFGLYLVVVGLRGNGGLLITALSEEGEFIPFITALSIFYFMWKNAPGDLQKPVRALITALAGTVLISQYQRIISSVKTAWGAVENLGGSSSTVTSGGGVSNSSGAASPNQTSFLQSIFPQAQQTANALGVPVSAVLGQSALETNWGQDFAANNNYFNVTNGGAPNYVNYSSESDSFAAYQNLIQGHYSSAVGAATPLQYGEALQAGGYATDPLYASKLNSVANSTTIQNFLASQGGNSV